MKYLLVLLALMPLAMGAEIQEILVAKERSISSRIVDAIEAAKLQMPCGFPGLGIPPLAPLRAEHREININGSIKAFGEVNNFRMDGLDNFDIVDFRVNTILSRVTYEFNWNHVYLNTDYEMEIFGLKRSGKAKFAIKNLKVWGVIKYSLGLISGNLRLKEFTLYVSLGEVISEIEGLSKIRIINKKMNEIIEEWVMLAVNDNTENFSVLTNTYVVPKANELIGDRSLSEVIGIILGGGGGSSVAVEKETCVPSEDY